MTYALSEPNWALLALLTFRTKTKTLANAEVAANANIDFSTGKETVTDYWSRQFPVDLLESLAGVGAVLLHETVVTLCDSTLVLIRVLRRLHYVCLYITCHLRFVNDTATVPSFPSKAQVSALR